MSDHLAVFVAAIILALFGALISTLALLPPIRRLCRRNTVARTAMIGLLAFVAFGASLGLATRLGAEVSYIFANLTTVDTFDASRPVYVARPPDYEANRPFVVRELWVRHLIPPPLRQRCYTSEAWVCEKADQVLPGPSVWNNSSYLKGVGLASIPMVVSGVLAWLFTRRKLER